MKKIVILSNHHSYTYNFRKEIIRKLIDDNYKVYIVLPYGEKVELLKEMGCEFIDLPLDRRGINPITDLKLLLSYYKILKKIKPDVVLSYTIKPNLYGGLACRLMNIPFLPNVTGLGTAIENKGPVQFVLLKLYKLAFKKASCIFFQNQQNHDFFRKHKITIPNYRVIPGSGINLDEYPLMEYPSESGNVRILFIGRIMRDKGIEELIEAAKTLKSNNVKVDFEAVGFYEDNYIDKIKKLDKLNVIKFHGPTNNVKKYIEESHAVILPSYHEGMSNVLLEAASMGRPILASSIPGCIETFDEGITGFGFEPKSVISIAQAIYNFLDLSYEQKKDMGLLGNKKVTSEFDRMKVVEMYMERVKKAVMT